MQVKPTSTNNKITDDEFGLMMFEINKSKMYDADEN